MHAAPFRMLLMQVRHLYKPYLWAKPHKRKSGTRCGSVVSIWGRKHKRSGNILDTLHQSNFPSHWLIFSFSSYFIRVRMQQHWFFKFLPRIRKTFKRLFITRCRLGRVDKKMTNGQLMQARVDWREGTKMNLLFFNFENKYIISWKVAFRLASFPWNQN